MDLPVSFPSESEVVLEDVARFRHFRLAERASRRFGARLPTERT